MAAEPRALLTHEEYFALEQATGERHEYVAGHVVAFGGRTGQHSMIAVNVIACLGLQLRQTPHRMYNCSLRIAITPLDMYTYADGIVVADKPIGDAHGENLTNPLIIVEVSSRRSATYDRTRKFARYQYLPSLRDYVLVTDSYPWVERFSRRDDGQWLWESSDDLHGMIRVPSIDCELPLAEVYAKVDFAEAAG